MNLLKRIAQDLQGDFPNSPEGMDSRYFGDSPFDRQKLNAVVEDLVSLMKDPMSWEINFGGALVFCSETTPSVMRPVIFDSGLPDWVQGQLQHGIAYGQGCGAAFPGIQKQFNLAKDQAKKAAKTDPNHIERKQSLLRKRAKALQEQLERTRKRVQGPFE